MASFFSNILNKFSGRGKIDWDELEETLISSDLGVRLSMEIVTDLQNFGQGLTAADVVEVCREKIIGILTPPTPPVEPLGDRPKVILMVGVNGVGKTTSTAKLARHFQAAGHSVVLAAADTFRAAAIEQLQIWGGRLDIPVVAGPYKADPSSICHDAYRVAAKQAAAFLICDTAGRLHTRHNLMEELAKTKRVIARQDSGAPHETLLVVDATTGSNGLSQAREFAKMLDLTGLVVTKLDGSGKGGVVVAIKHELGIPTKFIGTGESAEDLQPFSARRFVNEIL
ncbi:hypothetical protein BH23VER1_BH23VER1_28520 [soil metagenome]